MVKSYKKVSKENKIRALRKHLVEKQPVSQICDELGVSPKVYYFWQSRLFENVDKAFEKEEKESQGRESEEKIKLLEQKLKTREEALAELMVEHVNLKKKLNGEV